MKKYTWVFLILFLISPVFMGSVYAQQKIKLQEGIHLVMYGNKAIIEDDNNQRSISIEIIQEEADRKNNEKMYKVVCGTWSRRVVKDGLDAAIKAGIDMAGASKGLSLTVTAIAKATKYIYDDACDYWEKKQKGK